MDVGVASCFLGADTATRAVNILTLTNYYVAAALHPDNAHDNEVVGKAIVDGVGLGEDGFESI